MEITPSVIACGDATFPKGTAFGGGDKVSGIAQRRPLGGAGAGAPEGVSAETPPVCCADSPLWDGAFGMAGEFLAEVQSFRERLLPLGGAVAQRLRGYEWKSEKSVKAIAPTGAALAFLCFDFFFRIVKGVQPLTCCGVGGVQR